MDLVIEVGRFLSVLLICKAFGVSRVKGRRRILGRFVGCLHNCKAFGGSRVKDPRYILGRVVMFTYL